MKHKLLSVIFVAAIALTLAVSASAHDVPDLERLSSITLTLQNDGAPVVGGTITLYRVGEIAEADGNYYFVPTGDFASTGESFESLEDADEIAKRLADHAKNESLTGVATKKIGDDGVVAFDSLEVGLYLAVQYKAAEGYKALAPFLVSLPYMENGTYVYDVAANPKSELEKEPETEPPKDPDPSLPQTGQLWWPVPVLVCGGLLSLTLGVILKRKDPDDEA